eukprot:GFYU01008360.1.p1 GENE.GFYU01008360.1~~GFYU01008360.1.p1  ORF type:complete len:127 (+),score=23.00 GFYU01008360.1:23-403(+)
MSLSEIQSYFEKLVAKVPGCYGALMSDRDGCTLVRVAHPDHEANFVLEPQVCTQFHVASENSTKMKLGRNKSMVCFYEDSVLINFSFSPVIVSFLGAPNTNVGMVQAMEGDIRQVVEPLRQVSENM